MLFTVESLISLITCSIVKSEIVKCGEFMLLELSV